MKNREILDSWKEIASYLGRSEKTCRRLEKEIGLPVHRLEESPKARVFAYKDEIDSWKQKTQHSEKNAFIDRLQSKRFFIPASILIVMAIAVLIWQLLSQKAPISSTSKKMSVAVLPFEDLSKQRDQGYFCDGFAESLINALTKLKSLRVPAPMSSFLLRGKE